MNMTNKILSVAGLALTAGALAYLNYRRFVPRPESQAGTSYEIMTQAISVRSGDHIIRGELLLPKGIDGKLPTVICSHGLGSSGKNVKNLIGMSLAMSGLAVFCFDFWGGNLHSRSGGKMWEMSVFSEQEDLNSVIDHIKSLDTTDCSRLFLLGESQGGFVTAITAAQRPDDFRAVILYYPAFCIPEDARKRHGSAENIPERENFGGSILGKVYSEKLMDYDVYDVIPAYTGPVLIIHGDNDDVVDYSYSERAKEVYQNAQLVRLPGEIHGFTGDGRKKAARLSYDFLQRFMSSGDQEEILTIDISLQESSIRHEGIYNIMTIPFIGNADSKWFQGTILPGAADVQRRILWKTDRFCADYLLEGTDCDGEACSIHIVNINEGNGWKPTITTDSKALDFLNYGECRAVLEAIEKGQLIVRIYADPNSKTDKTDS